MKVGTYSLTHNVGKCKYVVMYCTGEKQNKDGSNCLDVAIFKNKKDTNNFITELQNKGLTNKF